MARWMLSVLVGTSLFQQVQAQSDKLIPKSTIDQKTSATLPINSVWLNYNNWGMRLRSNGSWSYDPGDIDGNGTNSGGEFPRGSSTFVNYAGGLIVASTRNGIPIASEVRFTSEFSPGLITNAGPTSVSEMTTSNLSTDRLYLIDQSLGGADYVNWPFSSGAPLNPSGSPLIISSADTWCSFHDADTSLSQQTGVPAGLGMEIQRRTYVWNVSGYQNTVFIRFILTNKSNSTYDSVFVGLWGDPDVDNATNDLVGSDTARHMIFCYNGSTADQPIAVGYRLLATSFDGITARAHSMSTVTNGVDANSNADLLNLLRGLTMSGGSRSGGAYDYPGDPVTASGVLDPTQGDKRMILGTGPVRFEPGQSHQWIYAVTARSGTDRLNAISNLRTETDAFASIGNSTVFRDPFALTREVTEITGTSATVHGMVLPNGQATTVMIQYGLNNNYGTVDTIVTSSDSNSVSVSFQLSDLSAATTYHYRIVASNATGQSYGQDQTFTTQAFYPPAITGSQTANISETSFRISAIVNPGGLTTTVLFESGPSDAYGHTDTVIVPPGFDNDTASATLDGLLPNTVYHYRITAFNDSGLTQSGDSTLMTLDSLTIWMPVHQNPVLTRYADVFVISDTTLQSPPAVRLTLNNVSTAIVMQAIPSQQSYRGTLSFTTSGIYTLHASAVSVSGSSDSISRIFSVAQARAGHPIKLEATNGAFEAAIPAGAIKEDTYLMAAPSPLDCNIIETTPVRLDREAEIRFSFLLTDTVDTARLFIYQQVGDQWVRLRSRVYPQHRLIVGRTSQLGNYKLAVDPTFTGTNVVPSEFALHGNYPNPFNPTTTIAYDLATDGNITLGVFNLLGQRVRTLVSGYQLAGSYRILWNGQNDVGHQVSSGVYFYRLHAGRYVKTNRMVLLK